MWLTNAQIIVSLLASQPLLPVPNQLVWTMYSAQVGLKSCQIMLLTQLTQTPNVAVLTTFVILSLAHCLSSLKPTFD